MISWGLPAGVIPCFAGAAPHSAVGMILNSGIVQPPSVVGCPDGPAGESGRRAKASAASDSGQDTGQISHFVPRRSSGRLLDDLARAHRCPTAADTNAEQRMQLDVFAAWPV